MYNNKIQVKAVLKIIRKKIVKIICKYKIVIGEIKEYVDSLQ
jgi:hypothetical protein